MIRWPGSRVEKQVGGSGLLVGLLAGTKEKPENRRCG